MDLTEILQAAVKHGASDVHIVPGRPPFLRINGTMRGLSVEPFSKEDTERMILGALREELVEKFRRDTELDTSFQADGTGRFRLNVLQQKDGLGAVLRVIPTEIPVRRYSSSSLIRYPAPASFPRSRRKSADPTSWRCRRRRRRPPDRARCPPW